MNDAPEPRGCAMPGTCAAADELAAARATHRTQAATITRLRTVLRFYADQENYWQRRGGFAFLPDADPGIHQAPVILDCGERAREALKDG